MLRTRLVARATWLAVTALLVVAIGAVAADDTTPPTGGMQVVDWHYQAQVFDLALTFADPESGIDHVDVHCDNLPDVSYPFASLLKIPYFDPGKGGCETNGWHWITVTAYNGAGLSASATDDVPLGYAVQLGISGDPTTGEPITLTPTVPDAFASSPADYCEWEVRWGNDNAILDNDYNATFGSLLIGGKRSKGFCDAWTFTLPYAPVPHYQVSFKLETPDEDVLSDKVGFRKDGSDIIRATVGTTERRITASNLPVMMVLPDAYIATVGEPITYRLYPAGGADYDDNDSWLAAFQAGEHVFTKAGGRSFTFTPDRVGDWVVFWNASGSEPYQLGAGYDPPARRADRTRPRTTTPVTKVGSGHVDSTVPGAVSWRGSDIGWGVDHYTVQRSVDGGAWGGARQVKGTSTTFSLTPGHSYRFRVRAIDKAGNKGTWAEGPRGRVRAVQETSGALAWNAAWSVVDDPEAWGGHSRQATTPGVSVVYAFTGRAIAWVAGRDTDRGKARVYLDGDLVATVDLATAGADPRRIVWRRGWSNSGAHKIRIEVVGNGAAIVDVDGFLVLR